MSILDLVAMASAQSRSGKLPYFVSTQVTEARRYFLELATKPGREIMVVCGGCERVRSDYLVDRSTFPFLVVEFVAEGAGSLELAGRRYRLRAGMTFSYGPGVRHIIRTEAARPMLKYFFVFAGTEGKRLLEESPLDGWKAVQVSSPIRDSAARRRERECLRAANLCRAGPGANHEDHRTGRAICRRRVACAGDFPPSETLD
jgi:hypothetical protein